MSVLPDFADILNQYVARSAYTTGQLAGLSGLPKTTIVNWLNGRVKRPREWQPLLRLGAALRLDAAEADRLLQAAGQPALAELRLLVREAADQDLLKPWPAVVNPELPSAPNAPFQAIPDTPYFVGREALIAQLEQLLTGADPAPVCILQGMAGAGKTTLAARLAYRLRSYFSDGVLWARLDTSDSLTILSTFAGAYGYDVSHYQDLDSRSQVVRGLLANRRTLLILDNVPNGAAVAPLLPPTGSCAVIITTRSQALRVAGAERFDIAAFPPDGGASQRLFRRMLGAATADASAATLARIADGVGHLPLALSIVAARLAHEPGWQPEAFWRRLQQAVHPLPELKFDDQSLLWSFDTSYARLSGEAQRFFAVLGLLGGEEFSPPAAAAAADLSVAAAEDQLRDLYSLSLVQAGRSGRYRLHPLLQEYARQREVAPAGTYHRLAAYYGAFVAEHQADYERLDLEYGNIAALLQTTAENGRLPGAETAALLTRLILALLPFLQARGLYEAARHYLTLAVEWAEAAGDSDRQVTLYLQQARIARLRRDFEAADRYLALARSLIGEAPGRRSMLLTEQGIVAACYGRYDQAYHFFSQSVPLARESGDPGLLIQALKELGAAEIIRQHYAEAERHYQEALALAHEHGRQEQMLVLLRCLGGLDIAHRRQYGAAQAKYEAGLTLAQELGHVESLIVLHNNLGVALFETGQRLPAAQQRAAGHFRDAAEQAERAGLPSKLAMVVANQGKLAYLEGDMDRAAARLKEALDLAVDSGHVDITRMARNSLDVLGSLQEARRSAGGDLVEEEMRQQEAKHLTHLTIFYD